MPNKILSLAYRPKSFSKMFGQEKITEAIRKQIASKRIPHTWMFIGETGSGKTTIARILGRSLNCQHRKAVPFGEYCRECRAIEKSLNYHEINASHIKGVDSIEEIAIGSTYAPTPPSKYRVYVLDEAQRLSKPAQNLLLKYCEEPPATTIWIVCTTEPEQILPALRSRASAATYRMIPLRNRDVEALVRWAAKRAGITRDLGEFIEYVHREGVTSARFILGALERYAAGLDPDKAASGATRSVDTLKISKALVDGEWNPIRQELERAVVDDVRYIHSAVIGFLRAALVARQSTVDRKAAAFAIKDLAQGIHWGQDDSVQLALLAAKLHDLCKKF